MTRGLLCSASLVKPAFVEKSGAKVLLATPAKELIVDNGRVVGVKAEGDNGIHYTIKAPVVS